MTLDEYLYDQGITLKEFCEIIGYHPAYVSQWKQGSRKKTKRLAYVINKATGGKVKFYA